MVQIINPPSYRRAFEVHAKNAMPMLESGMLSRAVTLAP